MAASGRVGLIERGSEDRDRSAAFAHGLSKLEPRVAAPARISGPNARPTRQLRFPWELVISQRDAPDAAKVVGDVPPAARSRTKTHRENHSFLSQSG